MFIVKETTTNTNATFGYPTEEEAQERCDGFNWQAANGTWNSMNYVVEMVTDNDAFKSYPF